MHNQGQTETIYLIINLFLLEQFAHISTTEHNVLILISIEQDVASQLDYVDLIAEFDDKKAIKLIHCTIFHPL